MLARDVMPQDVTVVHPETTVLEAAELMVQHHLSGLPGVDKAGKVAGSPTEGDLLWRFELQKAPHRSSFLNFLPGPGIGARDYV